MKIIHSIKSTISVPLVGRSELVFELISFEVSELKLSEENEPLSLEESKLLSLKSTHEDKTKIEMMSSRCLFFINKFS